MELSTKRTFRIFLKLKNITVVNRLGGLELSAGRIYTLEFYSLANFSQKISLNFYWDYSLMQRTIPDWSLVEIYTLTICLFHKTSKPSKKSCISLSCWVTYISADFLQTLFLFALTITKYFFSQKIWIAYFFQFFWINIIDLTYLT